MHFYYLDEAGCNGEDLTNIEQPVFIAGGVIIRDESWNKTTEDFYKIISDYFNDTIPNNFELHADELFSPRGHGFFKDHSRDDRNSLIHSLLDLLKERKHQTAYIALDKAKINAYDTSSINIKNYFNKKVPYFLAFDYLISLFEHHTKNNLGRSARGLLIIDNKDEFLKNIENITTYRRYSDTKSKRVKWMVEFSYPIDSKKNPMIQLSDLICFLTKKYIEIESGYRDNYPPEIKNIFRDFYIKIHERLIKKQIIPENGKGSDDFNKYLDTVTVFPSRNFRTKKY